MTSTKMAIGVTDRGLGSEEQELPAILSLLLALTSTGSFETNHIASLFGCLGVSRFYTLNHTLFVVVIVTSPRALRIMENYEMTEEI